MKFRKLNKVSNCLETKIRKCLKCRKLFTSEWAGNRSCKECLRRTPNNPVHNRYINSVLSETGNHVRGTSPTS